MAEINDEGLKKGKARAKKPFIKIDMTPMVDLAFLLLTFFILTTTLAEQKNLEILLPPDNDSLRDPVNNAVTIILSGNDELFYYEGTLKKETKLVKSDFKDIRKIIQSRNQPVYNNLVAFNQKYTYSQDENDSTIKNIKRKILDDSRGVYIIIKYDDEAKYRNTIDILDEMDVCGVPSGKYSVIDKMEAIEKEMLEKMKNK